MSESPKHVVGVVGNDITFDTRIRKVAAAAAAAGFKSTIVCYTASGAMRTTDMAGVQVIRVPVPFRAHIKNGRVPLPLRPFDGSELAARHVGPHTYQQMKRRRLEGMVAERPTTSIRIRLFALRAAMKIRRDTFRARRKAHVIWDKLVRRMHTTRRRATLRVLRSFRDGVPNIADYEVVLGPILEDLKPDLIHAHDYHMIGLAVTAARNLRRRGRPTKVVYDAHELIEGLSYSKPIIKGWLDLERKFIRHVDAVIGVSPEQLTQIRDRYGLEYEPTVVMNAPVTRAGSGGDKNIRRDIGVDGKILVYHGNVTPDRGLTTLVESLAYLDGDVHVAVIAPKDNLSVEEAKETAAASGLANRFHVLPYVPTEVLVDYISTASVGVVPYLPTGNNDIALPNKLFECIQAGLPVLVSDMRSLSRFVQEWSIGEVFRAGSAADLAAKATVMFEDVDRYKSLITDEVRREASWDSQATNLISVYAGLLGVAEVPNEISVGVDQITEDGVEDVLPLYRSTKLAIGPRNMAGQAYQIAAAVQKQLGIPAVSFSMEKPGYGFPIHRQISPQEWHDPGWQALQRLTLAREFTHVIAESGTGMLGAMNGGFIDEQLDILSDDGLQVAILLHGSEIRDPRRHRSFPYSPYAVENDQIRAIERANQRLRRHLARVSTPLFVTTPDLLADVEATWLPIAVDTMAWSGLKAPFQSTLPTVLHLPSNTALKGSEHVDEVLRPLEAQGHVRYLRPERRVLSSDVKDLIEEADIVIDQLVIGAYGLMSCQAMAAGRLTIANTRDLGSLRPEAPIIHADPDSLREVLHSLLDSKAEWEDRGQAGREFVINYHDGSLTAETLRPFLNLT